MNLNKIMAKLVDKHSLPKTMRSLLESQPWDKLLLNLANECVFNSNAAKNKKKKKQWYGMARLFHRARDEMVLQTNPFKISRRDIYECKCGKRFAVDPTRELNAKFDAVLGIMIVSCPSCGTSDG